MPRKKKQNPTELLSECIVDALLDKKAFNPVIIDFSKLHNTICDLFIICHSSSRVQSEAIADALVINAKKITGQSPIHREGFENAEWILIDYGDIIVHIFQEQTRKFFNLEQLWADAEIRQVNFPQ